jgi:hypothetical protein
VHYYALNGTDNRSHAEQGDAIAGYMGWRNARAQPESNFAARSANLPDFTELEERQSQANVKVNIGASVYEIEPTCKLG